MSLTSHYVRANVFEPILAIGFINFALTMMMLVMSTTIFARPSGVQMEFPSYGQGVDLPSEAVIITVTSENVIYIGERVVTLNELRRFLSEGNFRRDALVIKADHRASMGRVADILNLCRGIVGASVNVSTIL